MAIRNVSSDIIPITSAQMRAARAFLRWTAEDLAKAANIGVATVRRAEAEDEIPNMLPNNMIAIRRAFEAVGIEFANGAGQSVHFIKAKKNRPRAK